MKQRLIRLSTLVTLVTLLASLALQARSVRPTLAANVAAQPLSKIDRDLLEKARTAGKPTVSVLIAAREGQTAALIKNIAALGGKVDYQEASIDYVRASVPTGKVEDLNRLSEVQGLELARVIPLENPRPASENGRQAVTVAAPDENTPNSNPYMPIRDIGASQFMADHPEWDGRGIKIGIVDTGIDLSHPSLMTTSTGARKVVDWVTFSTLAEGDPTWINLSNANTQVTGVTTFTFNAVDYTAPPAGSGTYRIGMFNERVAALGGEVGNDVNRDGNPLGSSGIFPVLWDMSANRVYVDTNQDNSFADSMAMTDYKRFYDIGYFGTDNESTPVAERMPFVVQIDGRLKHVNIGIVSGAHGSHVAGITSANAMFGGAMSGAAPGAQLVSVRACLFVAGCTTNALLEGMIYAAKIADVDVINMSIGGLPALNNGNTARIVLYNRLIKQYNVQMFLSAGNSGPGVNTIGDPAVADDAMSLASSIHKDTWLANYGAATPVTDSLHYYSSRGPSESGAFKPSLMAPGSAISTTPMWQLGGPVAEAGYALPPGYSMFNGTSMAAPQAAGGAALLLSAAKQSRFSVRPDQLRKALYSSARYVENLGAYEQGLGMMQIGAAWDLLSQNLQYVRITSLAPTNTILGAQLAIPFHGPGIYEREGWEAGETGTRDIVFNRTTGGAAPITYNLSWVGNDGTFSSPMTIALPLNMPVTLTVGLNAATAGIHSSILKLDDPAMAGIEYQVLNTIIAAEQFTVTNNFAVVNTGMVDRTNAKRHFFYVPAGTPAFSVAITGTGQIRFLRFTPEGLNGDNNGSSNCYVPAQPAGCIDGSPLVRTATNPMAGVWEVTVDARRTSALETSSYTLTASIQGALVEPNPDVIPSVLPLIGVSRSYTITNLLGSFVGNAAGTPLASALRLRPTIAHLTQQYYTVTVQPGASNLTVQIGNPADAGADLDLFVRRNGVIVGQSAGSSSNEKVSLNNPVAGDYVVEVDGFAVPAGTTAYDYSDTIAHASYGSVTINDAPALRPLSSQWNVTGVVTANIPPEAGRFLLGRVEVVSNGAIAGFGEVHVLSVGVGGGVANPGQVKSLPLRFEENKGQLDAKVKYFARANGYNLFLASDEIVMTLRNSQPSRGGRLSQPGAANVLRMSWVGGNSNPAVSASELRSGVTNYLKGQNSSGWTTGVASYGRVLYQGIYPGMDLAFYDQNGQRQLEYDLLVAPGANPEAARFAFTGADKIEINAAGELVLTTSGGTVVQKAPVLYQEVSGKRQAVNGAYVLNQDGTFSFDVGQYDANLPLVIDPIVDYATYLGGADVDQGHAVAIDQAGNSYVTGSTYSNPFPAAGTAGQINGFVDAFVAKFNANGSLAYVTYFGGDTDTILEAGFGIDVDGAGAIYVTGYTEDADFPVLGGFDTALGGFSDAFVAKFNNAGTSLLYSSFIGGTGTGTSGNENTFGGNGVEAERMGGIAVEENGNAYIVGTTTSAAGFPMTNAFNSTYRGNGDLFLVRVNTAMTGTNSLVYSTYLGGTSGDLGAAVDTDGAGIAYVTGRTLSTNFPLVNGADLTRSGASDAFLSGINTTLTGTNSLMYSSYLGGGQDETGYAVVAAENGVFVAGATNSSSENGGAFPTSANAIQNDLAGGTGAQSDAFLAGFNTHASGAESHTTGTYLGGDAEDIAYALDADNKGNVTLAGSTDSFNFPVAQATQADLAGERDAFVATFNMNGLLDYSTYLGGTGDDEARGVAASFTGELFVTGLTSSADFPTHNAAQTGLGSTGAGPDAFVARLNVKRRVSLPLVMR